MIYTLDMANASRKVRFSMDLDYTYAQDQAILRFLQGGYPPEPELCQLILRAVRPGDVVVDGGANIGFFSLLASACEATVLAIEPCPQTCRKLLRNIEVNSGSWGNMSPNSTAWIGKVRQVALWDYAPARVTLRQEQNSGFNSVWGDESLPAEMVATATLDELYPDKPPRLIKLDIEGAEVRALEGGEQVLTNGAVLVVAECNKEALKRAGTSIGDMRSLLLGLGYDTFRLDPLGALPTLIPPGCAIETQRGNANVLFARQAQIAEIWPSVEI